MVMMNLPLPSSSFDPPSNTGIAAETQGHESTCPTRPRAACPPSSGQGGIRWSDSVGDFSLPERRVWILLRLSPPNTALPHLHPSSSQLRIPSRDELCCVSTEIITRMKEFGSLFRAIKPGPRAHKCVVAATYIEPRFASCGNACAYRPDDPPPTRAGLGKRPLVHDGHE